MHRRRQPDEVGPWARFEPRAKLTVTIHAERLNPISGSRLTSRFRRFLAGACRYTTRAPVLSNISPRIYSTRSSFESLRGPGSIRAALRTAVTQRRFTVDHSGLCTDAELRSSGIG